MITGELERKFRSQGVSVAGVDEVGRGCLAGPVYAAAVKLDYEKLDALEPKVLALIRDSKTLSQRQKEYILPVIKTVALEWSVKSSTVEEIDQLNILGASLLAMQRSVDAIGGLDLHILVDGSHKIPNFSGEQTPCKQGDSHVYAIAAASILAKIARDEYMQEQSKRFPQYGFEKHVGYGTKFHMQMLQMHGACEIHRRSFAPVQKVLKIGSKSSQPRV